MLDCNVAEVDRNSRCFVCKSVTLDCTRAATPAGAPEVAAVYKGLRIVDVGSLDLGFKVDVFIVM